MKDSTSVPKFVQITYGNECLYALDENGRVWYLWEDIPAEVMMNGYKAGWVLLTDKVECK